jgi:hypothetical protein
MSDTPRIERVDDAHAKGTALSKNTAKDALHVGDDLDALAEQAQREFEHHQADPDSWPDAIVRKLVDALESARDGFINLRPESGPMHQQMTKHIEAIAAALDGCETMARSPLGVCHSIEDRIAEQSSEEALMKRYPMEGSAVFLKEIRRLRGLLWPARAVNSQVNAVQVCAACGRLERTHGPEGECRAEPPNSGGYRTDSYFTLARNVERNSEDD